MSFINTINKTKKTISLYKLDEELLKKGIESTSLFSEEINICFIDVETTGLKKEEDEIIEIALRLLKIDKSTGSILSIEKSYESFNDSNSALDPKITLITGITKEMIKDEKIDWAIVGGIFVAEAMSVILQVGSYKLTGKRIFKMAPLHHHFEQKGVPESQIVIRFWIVAVILALVGLATLKIR